jgi:hypothetical protein
MEQSRVPRFKAFEGVPNQVGPPKLAKHASPKNVSLGDLRIVSFAWTEVEMFSQGLS